MKNVIICILLIGLAIPGFAQTHIDQNGIKTSVIGEFSASGSQAKRFEIAVIGFNSYHWQRSGILFIELFETYYGNGYEKYSIEIGYAQGTQSSSPVVKLIDSQGFYHHAQIVLGTVYDLTTSSGGYINKAIPVYLDIKSSAKYRVKLTYLRNRVEAVTSLNEIKVNEFPVDINISTFTFNHTLDQQINVTSASNHLINGGNVGIGTNLTSNPNNYKLAVNGKIGAKEVVVEDASTTWPDYVFEESYPLMPLTDLREFLTANKHLPDIPSAREIEQQGQSLGDMNVLLLKKIEELTLYILDQEKRLIDQQQQINELKTDRQ